jgi:CheY-like chemotaxis protein
VVGSSAHECTTAVSPHWRDAGCRVHWTTVPTVLIAAPEHLSVLKTRLGLGEILTFADADVLQALEAITSLRPDLVALEKAFADTSRGTALINRIRADLALKSCEIRLLLVDAIDSTLLGDEQPAGAPDPVVPVAPMDLHGTRRAERFAMAQGVEIYLEGTAVQLVDLSTVGAQVVSPTILRPNQRVRLTLSAQPGAPRFRSVVAWSSFELPQGVARYRAGIEILDGQDVHPVHKFIKKHQA